MAGQPSLTNFDEGKALVTEWKTADLLFQLTDQELSRVASLFADETVNASLLKSYVFIAIELKGGEYARGKFSAIARQINRLFPMPVMVFFRHQERLTVAVINRRLNKRDDNKDVLGKVTLISGIDLSSAHRGHLDILASLALPNLVHPQKKPITDFDTLHAAWEQIFNIELLNARFYKELANWYFWALPQVEFPADLEPDDEKRRATGLIRLLTRLVFCWFLKEKGLIPEKLFHPADLNKILKGFDPESETSSTYYQAILQNLFFATLNQRMGKDAKGQPYRVFAKDEGFLKNRVTYDVNNLYRYESLFREEPDAALANFQDIPFLNGGLFECLDRTEDGTDKKRYIDGFSRNAKKRPVVPDRLFFDSGETADLSAIYDDKKRKAEKVTGLINILNRYKFTIVENTPIDQEIALDPELLGKVFENLLASYNEETKTTARKQTGSFYTPRPIVDYMVDESLKAHLTRILVEKADMAEKDASAGLDLIFSYTEKEHAFNANEVACLIAAIDALKILDPACGSGAFPMGVLHKLVYILGKLDPDNERWKQTQLAKLDSAPMREDLARAFEDNADDYGRKLYLIENCLYGVDIQPIAIQISKLRFFISLVCDQKTNRNKKENHGIRPLPNLETKFVAADTLVGFPEIGQLEMEVVPPRVYQIEKEIEALYHSHFSIQRRDQKIALQRKLKALREEMANLLSQSLMSRKKSEHLAEWDPFDPQCSADFFDAHWMFGQSLANGFDVVIGNPPYGIQFAADKKKTLARTYTKAARIGDSYTYFILKGLGLLKSNGTLAVIVPNTFCDLEGGYEFRGEILTATTVDEIWQSGWVFSAAVVDTVVVRLTRAKPAAGHQVKITLDQGSQLRSQSAFLEAPLNKIDFRTSPQLTGIRNLIASVSVDLASLFTVKAGVKIYELGKGTPPQTEGVITSKPFTRIGEKPTGWLTLYRGGDIERYVAHERGECISYGPWLAAPRSPSLFSTPKLLMRRTDDKLQTCFDRSGAIAVNSCHAIQLKTSTSNDESTYLATLAILNSSVCQKAFEIDNPQMVGKTFSEIKVVYVERLPLPILSVAETRLLATLANCLAEAMANLRDERLKNSQLIAAAHFLDDLIDACVMECYFREHMAERDLLFHDTVAPHLAASAPEACAAQQREFLTNLHHTLNAPSHPIRNRLLRLTADSPDLLAIIKQEGRV
jgi:type I restriction-modification system DNA methylase subunit